MRAGRLDRRLGRSILAMAVIPTAVAEVVLVALYRRGAFEDSRALLVTVLVGLPAMMLCVGWIAWTLARSLVASVETIRHETELMAGVHPHHRIALHTGDELEALARDVNELGDQLWEARHGVEARIEHATRELVGERDKLAAIVGELAEGVLVAALDGRITLANRAARELLGGGGALVGDSLYHFMAREQVALLADRLRDGSEAPRFVMRPNGGPVLHAAISSFADGDGRVVGFILSLRPSIAPLDGADTGGPTSLAGAGLMSGAAASAPGPDRPALYDFSVFEEMERHVSPDLRQRRLDELTFVALDTETTGLRPDAGDRIVSLAGVRVRAGAVRRGETFDALVRPARDVPAASTRFHGITDAMVAEAPLIEVVLPAFLRFARGAVLVGHEVAFDVAFLDKDMRRLGLPALSREHAILDTRLLSRLVHGAAVDHSLEAVARRLGVAIVGRHSALGDALTTAEVLARLLQLLRGRGLLTLAQTIEALGRARPRD